MGSLREFLESQADQAQIDKASAASKRDEWISSVRRLLDQIRAWLDEEDPNRILGIEDRVFHLWESGIGEYDAPGLAIKMGRAVVLVEPIGRNAAGPYSGTGGLHEVKVYGRIDIRDRLSRHQVLRVEHDPRDEWIIIKQGEYGIDAFDRQTLGAALRDLFE